MITLIHHARLISPDLDIAEGSLRIVEGKIDEVIEGTPSNMDADRVIDAGGRMLMPGFFDIHAHGADRADVCDDSLDALHHIAGCKRREGVTTWLPTTLTQPRKKLSSIAATVATFIAENDLVRCPGMHVEGPFINAEKAGAQNPQFVRPPDWEEIAALHEIAPVSVLSLAPDVPGAIDLIRRANEAGITCSAAHTASSYTQIIEAKAAGLRHLTHYGNAMTPLHHREIGVVGAGLLDDSLRVEFIGDTIHLCPDMLRLMFQCISIDRLMLITDSMAASWIDHGEVMLGGLEVTVKEGTARLKDGGALAGSALRFNHGLKHLVETTGLPLDQLVKTTSWNQARSLGLDGFGRLEPGYHADLVALDDDFSVWQSWLAGRAAE